MAAVTGQYSAVLFWICLIIMKYGVLFPWVSSFFAASFAYLITGGWRYARVCFRTIRRDLFAFSILLRVYLMIFLIGRQRHGIREYFSSIVKRRGRSTVALMHLDSRWTFGEIDDYSNQIANFLHDCGIEQQENIALFMESEPRFIMSWLGAAKIGVVTGLINSNLRQESLINSITQICPKALIVGSSMIKAVTEAGIATNLPNEDIILFASNFDQKTTAEEFNKVSYHRIKDIIARYPKTAPPPLKTPPKLNDRLIYIFTSGTTGLPKAAIITFTRYLFMSTVVSLFMRIRQDDVVYTPLPLYHAVGCIIGSGQMLFHGVTQVIRTRFSASQFWPDCVRYKCTVVQYVGEICRYLLCQPHHKEEGEHCVRLAMGNGLRKEVWVEFVKRFNIKQIGEFYGATESNSNLCNSENKVGAVGFSSLIIPSAYPVTLIKMNGNSGEVFRDPKTGLCIQCQPGEVGQLVGRIKRDNPCRNFEGYINRKDTNSKILPNVLCTGDIWFQSGDLMLQDDDGFYYFVDRLGDTFRWRGENVSTTEVENIVAKAINFADCMVYGVEVPGHEGKAGMLMLAIDDVKNQGDTSDAELCVLTDLSRTFAAKLPPYARPLFVRFGKHVDTTDTFKFRKLSAVKERYNPSITTDHIYYLEKNKNQYKPLDELVYQNIIENRIRF